MQLIGALLVNIVSLLIVAYILPGFAVSSFTAAAVAAVLIGIVNTFIKPILSILTLPLTVLTLGIWAFILNVLLLYFVALVVPGFSIANFITAVIASILLSLISAFLSSLTKAA